MMVIMGLSRLSIISRLSEFVSISRLSEEPVVSKFSRMIEISGLSRLSRLLSISMIFSMFEYINTLKNINRIPTDVYPKSIEKIQLGWIIVVLIDFIQNIGIVWNIGTVK